jgi:hypothetical protein
MKKNKYIENNIVFKVKECSNCKDSQTEISTYFEIWTKINTMLKTIFLENKMTEDTYLEFIDLLGWIKKPVEDADNYENCK